MKRILKLSMLVAGLLLIGDFAYAHDDVNINYSKLPERAKAFVAKHFGTNPNVEEVEYVSSADVYILELRNGYDIKFDKGGKVIEIDSPERKDIDVTIVKDILPERAINYLSENRMLDDVEEIKISHKGDFLVEINKIVNDGKLRFDSSGKLINRRH